jgi:hypothetical protein
LDRPPAPPEQISENPALETKLLALDTLDIQPFDILKQQQNSMTSMDAISLQHFMLNDFLSPAQIAVALQGSLEDRSELFGRLDPTKKAGVARLLPLEALAGFPSLRRERRANMRELAAGDLREGKLYRALYSNRQLEEVLVDFWSNHFNIDVNKRDVFPYVASYERDAIRPYVLGHFKDMLASTARHPAMLYYLDNVASMAPELFQTGPNMTVSLDGSRGLNENYARELMELHTLGVDGGYTQEDVIQVARCFTGWSLRNVNGRRELVFVPWAHDTRDKVVLGQKIPSSGPDEVAQVLISSHTILRLAGTSRTAGTTVRRQIRHNPWWIAWQKRSPRPMATCAPSWKPCSARQNSSRREPGSPNTNPLSS